MKTQLGNEEIRWQVVKAMIDEFPTLKDRIISYVEEQENSQATSQAQQNFVV